MNALRRMIRAAMAEWHAANLAARPRFYGAPVLMIGAAHSASMSGAIAGSVIALVLIGLMAGIPAAAVLYSDRRDRLRD